MVLYELFGIVISFIVGYTLAWSHHKNNYWKCKNREFEKEYVKGLHESIDQMFEKKER